jgi:hypothetical protein
MAGTRALAVVVLALVVPACGSDGAGGDAPPAQGGEASAEAAFEKSYRDAWVSSCRDALADIRKRDAKRAAAVECSRPVEQMEGNTSYDAVVAAEEGRHQGTFDGCAYAWDEAYKASGEVEPRC